MWQGRRIAAKDPTQPASHERDEPASPAGLEPAACGWEPPMEFVRRCGVDRYRSCEAVVYAPVHVLLSASAHPLGTAQPLAAPVLPGLRSHLATHSTPHGRVPAGLPAAPAVERTRERRHGRCGGAWGSDPGCFTGDGIGVG